MMSSTMSSKVRKYQYDMSSLEDEFLKVCPDYNLDAAAHKERSMAVEFSKRILMDIGPTDARRQAIGTSQSNRHHWRVNICRAENPNDLVGVCYITSRDYGVPPKAHSSYIILTVQQAALLAVRIFNKSITEDSNKFLTPMACITFNRAAVAKLAKLLLTDDQTSIVRTINASCQPDGFYLSESRAHIGVLATIVWNILKDKIALKYEVQNVLNHYSAKGKQLDLVAFDMFAMCIECILPPDMIPAEKLIWKFKKNKSELKRLRIKVDKSNGKEAEAILVRFARIVLKQQK